jgi:hypothetical protein
MNRKGGIMSKQRFAITGFLVLILCITCLTALAEERFTDNGDGTVTDHMMGLMWAKTDNQGDISWKEARQWVHYTFPYTIEKRYDNWRMPTLNELKSLYVEKRDYQGYDTNCGQWVKIVPEIRISCGWLWSADTSAIQAYIFNFQRGYHYTDRMVHDRSYRVLPVRDLE